MPKGTYSSWSPSAGDHPLRLVYILAFIWVGSIVLREPMNSKTPGRIPKGYQPWGPIIFPIGILESRVGGFCFLDPSGGLGYPQHPSGGVRGLHDSRQLRAGEEGSRVPQQAAGSDGQLGEGVWEPVGVCVFVGGEYFETNKT